MEKKELKAKLLDIIKNAPGATLNEMFAHVKEELNGKFPPMYNVVKELKNEGKVKVDGKKKNTGHYLQDAVIPESVPKANTTTTTRGTRIAYERPNKKATKRYVLEKSENSIWRMVDEGDVLEPIENLYNQCIRLVPLHYRLRDQETESIINEREAPEKWPVTN